MASKLTIDCLTASISWVIEVSIGAASCCLETLINSGFVTIWLSSKVDIISKPVYFILQRPFIPASLNALNWQVMWIASPQCRHRSVFCPALVVDLRLLQVAPVDWRLLWLACCPLLAGETGPLFDVDILSRVQWNGTKYRVINVT